MIDDYQSSIFRQCRFNFSEDQQLTFTRACYYTPLLVFVLFYSAGRRSCLGESLAKMELFLCFSAFLQRFSLRLPEGAQKPDLDNPILGMTLAPPDYELCATYRRAPIFLG